RIRATQTCRVRDHQSAAGRRQRPNLKEGIHDRLWPRYKGSVGARSSASGCNGTAAVRLDSAKCPCSSAAPMKPTVPEAPIPRLSPAHAVPETSRTCHQPGGAPGGIRTHDPFGGQYSIQLSYRRVDLFPLRFSARSRFGGPYSIPPSYERARTAQYKRTTPSSHFLSASAALARLRRIRHQRSNP